MLFCLALHAQSVLPWVRVLLRPSHIPYSKEFCMLLLLRSFIPHPLQAFQQKVSFDDFCGANALRALLQMLCVLCRDHASSKAQVSLSRAGIFCEMFCLLRPPSHPREAPWR